MNFILDKRVAKAYHTVMFQIVPWFFSASHLFLLQISTCKQVHLEMLPMSAVLINLPFGAFLLLLLHVCKNGV